MFPTVNTAAVEVPPPLPGVVTVMFNDPAVPRLEAGIVAVNWPEETNVVVSGDPFTLIVDPGINPLPLTVKATGEAPTVADEGDRVIEPGVEELLTVNVWVPEVPPPGPGLTTLIVKVPGLVKSEVGSVAVNWLGDTKVVGLEEPLTLMVDPETKLDPLTVSVEPVLPAVMDVGERLVIAGTGLSAKAVSGIRLRAASVAPATSVETMIFLVFIVIGING